MPHFGKLLLLPHRSGTDRCVPLTCPLPAARGTGEGFPNTAKGCNQQRIVNALFSHLGEKEFFQGGGSSPKRRVSSVQECVVIDRVYLDLVQRNGRSPNQPMEGMEWPSSRNISQVGKVTNGGGFISPSSRDLHHRWLHAGTQLKICLQSKRNRHITRSDRLFYGNPRRWPSPQEPIFLHNTYK